MKFQLLLCLILSIGTLSAHAEETGLFRQEAQASNFQEVEESLFDVEDRGEGYKLIPYNDPKYIRAHSALDQIINMYKATGIEGSIDLNKVLLYLFEIDEEKYNSNFGILQVEDGYSAVMIKLSKEEIKNFSRETILFILGHEIGHGYVSTKKRYYLLDEDLNFKLARFTSEELSENEEYKDLRYLIDGVGFSVADKKPMLYVYESTFARILKLIIKGKLTAEERDEVSTQLGERLRAEFKEVLEEGAELMSYDRMLGDYKLYSGESSFVDVYMREYRALFSKHPKIKGFGFEEFITEYNIGEAQAAGIYNEFLIKAQTEKIGEEAFSKKNIVSIMFGAIDIYYERYKSNKETLDKIIPRVRFYSKENIADESSFKLLRTNGIRFESYAYGFLRFVGYSNEEAETCLNSYILNDVEPPVGALSDNHPAACWRMYNLKKLEDYYSK